MMSKRKFPFYGWIGIFLTITFWLINWSLDELRTHWGFFPMWLGLCLTVDAFVYFRKGTSMIKRNRAAFVVLFFISIPVWWLFEFFNSVTENWIYEGKQYFTDFEYFILGSISFSTVMPAVFSSAELAGTFKWIRNLKIGFSIQPNKKNIVLFFSLGILMLLLIFLFPKYFYPLIWLAPFLIIEAVNVLFKNRSLLHYIKEGDWKIVISLWIGCLICAFFWEMWNYFSYPKWVYSLPYLNFLHLFEMPVLGYIGYLPFSMELFAIYHLVIGLMNKKDLENFIQLIPNKKEGA